MKLRLVQRKNPLRRNDPAKWYANVVKYGTMTIESLTEVLSRASSLTRADMQNAVTLFTDEVPTYLKMGHSVQLGELGTLRLSATSEGADTKEEFKTLDTKIKIIFTPGVALKKAVSDVKLEVEKDGEEPVNP